MRAFLYGLALQWRLDIRSKTLLITCYFVPLLFFAVMGGIFTSLMPETRETLIASMSIFGISMGALIGVPPTLVETYGSDIIKGYRANGVPVWLPLILTELSACFHLLLMGLILYMAAPLLFDAKTPDEPAEYFGALVLFIAVSVAAAGVIGLAVKEQSRTSMFSILFFLPSILLSGILFPGRSAAGGVRRCRKPSAIHLGIPADDGKWAFVAESVAAVPPFCRCRRAWRIFPAPGRQGRTGKDRRFSGERQRAEWGKAEG